MSIADLPTANANSSSSQVTNAVSRFLQYVFSSNMVLQAAEFPQFGKLPAELREQIWLAHIDLENTIKVDLLKTQNYRSYPTLDCQMRNCKAHPTLHVNRESRMVAFRRFQKNEYLAVSGRQKVPRYLWWNPTSTMLFESFGQLRSFDLCQTIDQFAPTKFHKKKITSIVLKCLPAKEKSNENGPGATGSLFNKSELIAEKISQYCSLQRLVFVESSIASMGVHNVFNGSSPYVTITANGSKEEFIEILKAKAKANTKAKPSFSDDFQCQPERSSWWENPTFEIMTEEEYAKTC